MKYQSHQLEERLTADGWRVVDRVTAPDWWADEIWTIESTWRPIGRQVWITFLVDPQHDGSRGPGEHVWAVGASRQPPGDRREVTAVPIRNGWAAHLEELADQVLRLRDDEPPEASIAPLDRLRRYLTAALAELHDWRQSPDSASSPPEFYETAESRLTALLEAKSLDALQSGVTELVRTIADVGPLAAGFLPSLMELADALSKRRSRLESST